MLSKRLGKRQKETKSNLSGKLIKSLKYIPSEPSSFKMATVEAGKATAVPDTERDPNYGQGKEMDQEKTDRIIKDDKVELQDSDAWDKLGYSFPTWRKW